MDYILDMVHHNPGEAPFRTAFTDPSHLADYGFNGQVLKHINCVADFAATGLDLFPAGSKERVWLDERTAKIEAEIAGAKAQGLRVFYHIDLFVLPRRLVETFRSEICDPDTGRILLDRPKTLELHRLLFDELTQRFPAVGGYFIRVGETYLFDTPYHVGNGPIPRLQPSWTPTYGYGEILEKRQPGAAQWTPAQVEAYVNLLEFLRAEVCEKHGKTLFFRTWDIFPDKLHARLDHYLEVTDRIEPHPRLIFSIKHTALDFWRRVKVNPCLTRGKHPQIIEVQCQREYEGKGAYPNYVMDGIINGFEENREPVGLVSLFANPKIVGVFSWSRGGGWYGPYIPIELWPDLNAYVLARFTANPARGEEAIFGDYAREILHLGAEDTALLRRLCLLSAKAILKGRHCEAFDQVLEESVLPTALWMRDDRLGGHQQLEAVLGYLHEHRLTGAALQEKKEAMLLWEEIETLASRIHWNDGPSGDFVKISAAYGARLFTVVYHGWRMMTAGYAAEHCASLEGEELAEALEQFARSWENYQALGASPLCPSLYEARYFSLPGQPEVPGLQESVRRYAGLLKSAAAGEATPGVVEPFLQQPSTSTVLGSVGTP